MTTNLNPNPKVLELFTYTYSESIKNPAARRDFSFRVLPYYLFFPGTLTRAFAFGFDFTTFFFIAIL